MSVKIYRHTSNEKYSDMIIIGIPTKRNNRVKIGCIIGVKNNQKEFPIGFYSKSFGGFSEIKESISLKSKDRLFTNGRSVIIKNDENKYIIISKGDVKEMGRVSNGTYIKDAHQTNNDTLWVDGGGDGAGWFKRVDEIKFENK
ncbi:MAG: hypothetical protein SLAVMIC_00359 [uncultured marine phage]|uniref:Uncharacterized protein n=1 Tax=uncultured marine phage TaxID=707152 RepID=A0A8D9FRH0_9VIRU|nr:MAG: hypothetical protein SLAVMIC_00359 [uncultured marine phage]